MPLSGGDPDNFTDPTGLVTRELFDKDGGGPSWDDTASRLEHGKAENVDIQPALDTAGLVLPAADAAGAINQALRGNWLEAGISFASIFGFDFLKGFKGAPKVVEAAFSAEQRSLQHLFSGHAKDFGITGNWSKSTAAELENALRTQVNSLNPIKGTYRGTQDVLHYFDSKTGLNVMTDLNGKLVGGWKLSADQIKYLTITGTVK